MSANAALQLVRQFEAVVSNLDFQGRPDVVSSLGPSLQFLLSHPDGHVRLGAARAFRQLARRCPVEFAKQDLSRARAALVGSRKHAAEVGRAADADVATLLEEAFTDLPDGGWAEETLPTGGADGDMFVPPTSAADVGAGGARHGQLVLELPGRARLSEAALRSDILKSVVNVGGVVSAAFDVEVSAAFDVEADKGRTVLVVQTRSVEFAGDAVFQADVIATIEELESSTQGVSVVTYTGAQDCVGDDAYLDEEGCFSPHVRDIDALRSEGDALKYIDDEHDSAPPAAPKAEQAPSSPSPSCATSTAVPAIRLLTFFNQGNMLNTWQKLHEFEEDPSIVARLRKARVRDEQKKREERSRLGKLLSVLGVGRSAH